ncbi:urease accessory protein [Noviherbaspirillum humi]|uniref:Urease accessory protein UreD n=1 Tax=Noviherbaspirillum humi TaxID=1688639 RepID=A0A239J922_9BURK|nr:urease accessory protein UreD [Noviherbaspirillum humi]SNT02132.1 urease accessory protein [Noviherbaspirillum humi]
MKRFIHLSDPVSDAPAAPSWRAQLALGFADDGGTTRLVERSHSGPLRVQKPLYPEGAAPCHAIVVHPPGGVVGGDQLALDIRLQPMAHALIATPGAAKWYKANGRQSAQTVTIDIAAGAALEWLPQETIFFDQAEVALETTIALHGDARYLGCEILCFGRTASGERFDSGRIAQRTRITRDGRLLWLEQGALDAALLGSPLMLAGRTVCATLIAVGPALPPSVLAQVRESCAALAPEADLFGATQMKTVLVVRHLGQSSEVARRVMLQAWRVLRPALLGREAVVPRIWNT